MYHWQRGGSLGNDYAVLADLTQLGGCWCVEHGNANGTAYPELACTQLQTQVAWTLPQPWPRICSPAPLNAVAGICRTQQHCGC